MAKITEDYCSYEVARLLKEKGFDGDCYTFYEYDNKELYREERIPCCNSRSDDYAAPTLQMTMKWLREVHNRFIEVQTDKGYDFKNIVFRPAIYDEDLYCLWESDNYKSYEEACEVAIKYCLENLI